MAPNFKFGVFYLGEEKENKKSYAKNILMIGGDIGMIRVRFRTIIIPRGDTGFISFPNVGPAWDGDVAVFSLLDKMTRKTVLEKIVDASDESLFFYFNTEDTKDLEAKTYYWDINLVLFLIFLMKIITLLARTKSTPFIPHSSFLNV